jgi:FecR protein
MIVCTRFRYRSIRMAIVSALLLVLLTLCTEIALSEESSSSQPYGKDLGVWVLQNRTSTIEQKADDDCYSRQLQIAANSVTGSTSWDDACMGGKCAGHNSGTCIWTSPPQVLTPGTKQESTNTVSVEGGQSCGYKHTGAWLGMYANGGKLEPYPNIGWSTDEPKPSPDTKVVSWEVPWGKIGDTMTVEFYPHHDAIASGGIIYTYEYQAQAPKWLPKSNGNISDDTVSGVSLPKRSGEPVAFIERIEGQGDFKVNGLRVKPEERISLHEGDTVSTGPASEVLLRFGSGAILRIKENTDYLFGKEQVQQTNQDVVYGRLIDGIIHFYLPKGYEGAKRFDIDTDRVTTSITGTKLIVKNISNATTIQVLDGSVNVLNKATGELLNVYAGEAIVVSEEGVEFSSANDTADSEEWQELMAI